MSMENHHTSLNVECSMVSCMLGCTLLIARCMIAFGSSIACSTAVVNPVPPAGACSNLNPEAADDKWGLVLATKMFGGWICETAGNRG